MDDGAIHVMRILSVGKCVYVACRCPFILTCGPALIAAAGA